MISRLTGKLIEKQPPQIVIDVNGVAYAADVSMQTFYNLPPLNETVQLYTQLVVREDAHLLFGFGKKIFQQLFIVGIKIIAHTVIIYGNQDNSSAKRKISFIFTPFVRYSYSFFLPIL